MGGGRLWRILSVVFVVAVAVNYPWEMLQSSLYVVDPGATPKWLHCLVASLGDGVLVLLILVLGWIILGRLDWFLRPRGRGYAVMLAFGLLIGIAVELVAVRRLGRWGYKPEMPLLPLLGIGVVPILQMLVLPPVILRLAALFPARQRTQAGKRLRT